MVARRGPTSGFRSVTTQSTRRTMCHHVRLHRLEKSLGSRRSGKAWSRQHEKVLERWYSEVVVWGKRLSWSGLSSSSAQRRQWWLVLGSASSSNVGLLFVPCSEKAEEKEKGKGLAAQRKQDWAKQGIMAARKEKAGSPHLNKFSVFPLSSQVFLKEKNSPWGRFYSLTYLIWVTKVGMFHPPRSGLYKNSGNEGQERSRQSQHKKMGGRGYLSRPDLRLVATQRGRRMPDLRPVAPDGGAGHGSTRRACCRSPCIARPRRRWRPRAHGATSVRRACTPTCCGCWLPQAHCRSCIMTLPPNYYKSSLLWFIVEGTKALVRSTRMNTGIYVVWAARA
jgi:hypothetical protein